MTSFSCFEWYEEHLFCWNTSFRCTLNLPTFLLAVSSSKMQVYSLSSRWLRVRQLGSHNWITIWTVRLWNFGRGLHSEKHQPISESALFISLLGFNVWTGKCKPFIYTGCGNCNRFGCEEKCKKTCESAVNRESIDLNNLKRLSLFAFPSKYRFWDDSSIVGLSIQSKINGKVHYGGCRGKRNIFETESECEAALSQSFWFGMKINE